MPFMTVRHFTAADIPIRSELLRESRFQANLTDFAMSSDDDGLIANQRATIDHQHHDKRIFTLCGAKGQVVGFAWITSIDWRAQRCELSFGVLPRYRGGFGFKAVEAAHVYLRTELNMRVVVNQVLEHNTMLQSAESMVAKHQVRCGFDSYTVGEWRNSYFWSLTEQDEQARQEQEQIRRQTLADRVRATVAQSS